MNEKVDSQREKGELDPNLIYGFCVVEKLDTNVIFSSCDKYLRGSSAKWTRNPYNQFITWFRLLFEPSYVICNILIGPNSVISTILYANRRFWPQGVTGKGLIRLCLQVRSQVGRGSLCDEAGKTAITQIKIHKLKEKDKQNALNEIRFLASIESPFVVSYKEAFYDEKSETLCIVMEMAN